MIQTGGLRLTFLIIILGILLGCVLLAYLPDIQSDDIEIIDTILKAEESLSHSLKPFKNIETIKPKMMANMNYPLNNITYQTSHFGIRIHPISKTLSYHDGLDIACSPDNNVYSALSGIVSFTGYDPGYGNYVVMDHGDHISTLYGHLSKILVPVSTYLEQGELLGKSGATGRVTGPHLHFEIREYGIAINPSLYIFKNVISP